MRGDDLDDLEMCRTMADSVRVQDYARLLSFVISDRKGGVG
jgi:hypothetical protein